MSGRESGFTLIEILVALGILISLVAIAIPAYHIYMKNSQMTVAETNLRNGLKYFAAGEDYHPPTGALKELVTKGYLQRIPNDPWTPKKPAVNNYEEVSDWVYVNNGYGNDIVLYAASGRGNKIKMESFGNAPAGGKPAAKPLSAAAKKALKVAAMFTKAVSQWRAFGNHFTQNLPGWRGIVASIQKQYAKNPTPATKRYLDSWVAYVAYAERMVVLAKKMVISHQKVVDRYTALAATL